MKKLKKILRLPRKGPRAPGLQEGGPRDPKKILRLPRILDFVGVEAIPTRLLPRDNRVRRWRVSGAASRQLQVQDLESYREAQL